MYATSEEQSQSEARCLQLLRYKLQTFSDFTDQFSEFYQDHQTTSKFFRAMQNQMLNFVTFHASRNPA